MVDKLNMELLKTKPYNSRTWTLHESSKTGSRKKQKKLHTVISQLQEFAAVAVEADCTTCFK